MLAFGTYLTPSLSPPPFFRAGGLFHRPLPSAIFARARYLAGICKTHRCVRLHSWTPPSDSLSSLTLTSRPLCLLSVARARYSPRSTTVTSATAPTQSVSAAPVSARARASPRVRRTERLGPPTEVFAAVLGGSGHSPRSFSAVQLAIVPPSSLLVPPLRSRAFQPPVMHEKPLPAFGASFSS